MTHHLITDNTELEAFCREIGDARAIAVDTEFIREKTYFPQLCLIQICANGKAAAIDALAPKIDLAPVLALMNNPDVLKVFHAARQDLEIFYCLGGRKVPAPIFDTQIAAQFHGFGESISYGDFIRKMLGHQLDKTARFTDWAKRPLKDSQLDYALADVIHLEAAFAKQRARLEKLGRLKWVEEEMGSLLAASLYEVEPREAWRRMKPGSLKPKQLAVLREIAAWREEEAKHRDLPRGRIARDDVLLEIAALRPESIESLKSLRSAASLGEKNAAKLVPLVKKALESPPESWPSLPRRSSGPEPDADVVQLLQLLLAIQCRKHEILPRLVATRDEIEDFALGNREVHFLQDWRREIFGQAALDMMEGRTGISVDPERAQVRIA